MLHIQNQSPAIYTQPMQPSVNIRLARKGDEAPIHRAHMTSIREICVHDHGKEEIKGWGYRQLGTRWTEAIRNGVVWVAEFNNSIEGFCYIDFDKGSAHLKGLYLTPKIYKRGIGDRLLNLAFEEVRKRKINLIALSSSKTAYGFYKKYGFVDNGEPCKVNIGEHPVTCIPMRLNF